MTRMRWDQTSKERLARKRRLGEINKADKEAAKMARADFARRMMELEFSEARHRGR